MVKIQLMEDPRLQCTLISAIVYGVAYAGRTYLLIQPHQAALYALGTLLAHKIGIELINCKRAFKGEDPTKPLSQRNKEDSIWSFYERDFLLFCHTQPSAIVLGCKLLPPLHCAAALGLTILGSVAYFYLSGGVIVIEDQNPSKAGIFAFI